jgi:hypothetical protein
VRGPRHHTMLATVTNYFVTKSTVLIPIPPLLVASSPTMNHDIQSKIQQAAARFTDEILAVFSEAFLGVVSDLSNVAPAKRKGPAGRGKPLAAKRASAEAPRTGKRERRSGDDLAKTGERVTKLLSTHKKGMRIEEINRQLGTTTKLLMRPMLKLLEEGKIKKTGEKRATTYFPA